MNEQTSGYAVFLFEQALEALGEAIKPHVQDGPGGPHVLCQEVDTAGSFVEMTLRSKNERGESSETELMIPGQMVRMIISARGDAAFGFAGRDRERRVALPAVGPEAPPALQRSAAVPQEGVAVSAPAGVSTGDDRRLPPEG